MIALLWILGCRCGEPGAGELRDDVDGLGTRTSLPPGVTEVRWITQPARGARRSGPADPSTSGRADARVFAWVATVEPAGPWLTTMLGEPLGPRAHHLPGDVARALFTPEELAPMRHDETKDTYRFACVRYPPAALGLGDYRGDAVLDCDSHVYLALTAR